MENITATYDLVVRDLPDQRNFLLFGGLEEILESIRAWKYTKDEVDYLLKRGIITPKMAKLMRKFKFSGDIYAMPEGSLLFQQEPVLRLDGPIWQINLFTFFLINALTYNTMSLSKIVRSVLASQEKFSAITCPVTRAHSFESALKYGRSAYILGSPSALVPSFARKFNLPSSRVSSKTYHAFIKSFPSELVAMRAAASVFDKLDLMIDTYNIKQGIKNAIIVAKENGKSAVEGVVIDSGKDVYDFIRQARFVRKELDKAGLKKVKITMAGNFEEYKIAILAKHNAPIDMVVIATEGVTSSDQPKLEVVLKLAEIRQKGQVQYKAKLTPGKESYPGRKQVFRVYKKNKVHKDIIGLETEKLGKLMLKKVMTKGRLTKKLPNLDTLRKYASQQISTLPDSLKEINKKYEYPVRVSKEIIKIMNQLRKKHGSDK